jgi:hypothetical protein
MPITLTIGPDPGHLNAVRDQDQLPLPFPRVLLPEAVDVVHAPCNDAALAWLERVSDWPQGQLALWGVGGCGKTQLLRRWADAAGAHCLTGPNLPRLDELPELAFTAGLAIDDGDAITDDATLLHLLNAAAEAHLPVLLAARAPPARWPVRLPDLASRLRAITAVEILPPDDLLLRVLLARLLADRQHRVPLPTQEWLLARLPRTPGALREAVARLDRAALGGSGGITRRLARHELVDLIGTDLDDGGAGGEPASSETPGPIQTPAMNETTVSSSLPSPPAPGLL